MRTLATLATLAAALLAVLAGGCDKTPAQRDLSDLTYQLNDPATVAEAASELENLALQGNAEAQMAMGNLYFVNEFVEDDYLKAAYWYRLAGTNGEGEGFLNVSRLYGFEASSIQDFALARMYLAMSGVGVSNPADKADRDAHSQFLIRLRHTMGFDQWNPTEAFDLAALCRQNNYVSCDPKLDNLKFADVKFNGLPALVPGSSPCHGDYCPCEEDNATNAHDRNVCAKLRAGTDVGTSVLDMSARMHRDRLSE